MINWQLLIALFILILGVLIGLLTQERKVKELQQQIIVEKKQSFLNILMMGISHEIKNSLNFIKNFSILNLQIVRKLKKSVKDQEQTELFEDLIDNLERTSTHCNKVHDIIEHNLLWAKSNQNSVCSFDLTLLLQEAHKLLFHSFRASYENFNIKIVENYPQEPLVVSAPKTDLYQVILNVLSNAFYSVHQKKTLSDDQHFVPTVEIDLWQADDQTFIAIKDNGIGIAKENQKKIFNPFFSTKKRDNGTGLGLYLSREIIEKNCGGQISFTSENFTEFMISFPLERKLK